MTPRVVDSNLLNSELTFAASRSDGPGGQNVNKVNTKVTLKFDVEGSAILNEMEKELLRRKLKNRLTKDGVLLLAGQASRSQLQNKEDVIAKFDQLLMSAFLPVKRRKKTKPSKASKEKRMKSKRLNSEKKQWRKDL